MQELFESRGREAGHELEDWLRAESELVLPVLVGFVESADPRRSIGKSGGDTQNGFLTLELPKRR